MDETKFIHYGRTPDGLLVTGCRVPGCQWVAAQPSRGKRDLACEEHLREAHAEEQAHGR